VAGGFRSLALPELGGVSALGPGRTTSSALSVAVSTNSTASAALSALVRLDGGWRSVALLELGGISAPRTGMTLSAPLSVYIRQGGFRSPTLMELGGLSAVSVPASKANATLSVVVQQAGTASALLSTAVQDARTTSAALSAQVVATASGFRGIALIELGGISAAPPQTPKVPVYDDGVPQGWASDIGWSAIYAYQPLGIQPAFNQRVASLDAALSVVVDVPKLVEAQLSSAVLESRATNIGLSVYIRQDGGFRGLMQLELGGVSAVPPQDPGAPFYDDGLPLSWGADIGWAATFAYEQIGMPVFNRVSNAEVNLDLSVGVRDSYTLAADLSVLVYSNPELPVELSAAIEMGVQASADVSVAVLDQPVISAALDVCVNTPLTVLAELSAAVSVAAETSAPMSAALSVVQEAEAAVDVVVAVSRETAADLTLMVMEAVGVTVSADMSAAVLVPAERRADISVAVMTQPESGFALSAYVDASHPVSTSSDLSVVVQLAQRLDVPVTAVVVNSASASAPLSAMVMRNQALQSALSVYVYTTQVYRRAPSGSGFAPRLNDTKRPRR
jgi:hypothetical protein